jgi:alkylation response protein AidB-like acyl-CoA dehydrogenase
MHYAAASLLEAHGDKEVRKAIGAGGHLTTLAFSEAGSRSHFWAPLSSAARVDGSVRLDARKSWVTSASEADSYVWSSGPLAADGAMTLWLVPSGSSGLSQGLPFDYVLYSNYERQVEECRTFARRVSRRRYDDSTSAMACTATT